MGYFSGLIVMLRNATGPWLPWNISGPTGFSLPLTPPGELEPLAYPVDGVYDTECGDAGMKSMATLLGAVLLAGAGGCSEVRYVLVGVDGPKVAFQQRSTLHTLIARKKRKEDLCVFDAETERWEVFRDGQGAGLKLQEGRPVNLSDCSPDKPVTVHGVRHYAVEKQGHFLLLRGADPPIEPQELARVVPGKHFPPRLLPVEDHWLLVTARGVGRIHPGKPLRLCPYPDNRWAIRAADDLIEVPPRILLELLVWPLIPVPR